MNTTGKRIAVIGSGFSGLSAACVLAKSGNKVTIFEKNDQIGGRARTFSTNGYLFDMGPSWYWMPDVFEKFFSLFGKKASDYYSLKLLDPGFSMIFSNTEIMDIPASMEKVYELFEKEEENGAEKLKNFLREAELKYNISFEHFIYKPSSSLMEFANLTTLKNVFKLDLFNSFRNHIRKFFKSEKLIRLMEFPILFLGGSPENIPSLYSMMNYSALVHGTWYPEGGFSKITHGMLTLAKELGVEVKLNENVKSINTSGKSVNSITTSSGEYNFDGIIGSSDYAHTEKLLKENLRNYNDEYWDKKVFSPSCLIFYLGIKKKIERLIHSDEIYKDPKWPSKPLFYVCCPSKTDSFVAPEGHENLFVLMPLAAGLQDDETLREKYFKIMMKRLECFCAESIETNIDFKRSYCLDDFKNDYNSCKGNAYGLANTLRQTAIMKPALRNKKLSNLLYCGQLTVPGPGVPPALISGQIAAEQLIKTLN
jgi:phytoene desaturase